MDPAAPGWQYGRHGAIAATSCAVLLFEVLMTRILSVTLSYHFAFLTISLAMLGLAAPGVWFSLETPRRSTLFVALYASAVALPGAVLAIVHLGAPERGNLLFWIAVILVPMLTLGTSICVLLLQARGTQIARIYAADLGGAAVGALAAVPLLHGLSTPCVVAALGVLPLLAAILAGSRRHLVSLVYAAALVCSVVWGTPYRLRYARFYVEERPPLYEKWTATARITIFDRMNQQFLGWGMGARYRGARSVDHLWLDQDGSAGTPILSYQRGRPYPEHLSYDVVSAAYPIAAPHRACIIGGGGGRDILKALEGGATEVEVVEINPYTVDAVSRVFGAYSGDPYHLPGVHAFVGEGRNHFSRSDTPCDVIEISQIDTFAASAAGAYALTENSLYTVEAIRMFWSHLSAAGVLSVSRWVAGPAWPESVRLVLLEVEALHQEGITEPRDHMVVLAAGSTANVLLFRKPVTPQQLELAEDVAAHKGFAVLWPVAAGRTGVSELTRALAYGPADMTRRGYDVSPPTDDRPFFFQTLNILSGSSRLAEVGTEREQSVTLLRRLVGILAGLAFVLVLLPFAARGTLPRGPHLGRNTLFFSCLGFGFMFVEIPLLQRLAVYLGHPSYSTTVVLGSLLVGAGFGAWLAERIPESQRRIVGFLVPLVVGAIVFLLMWLAEQTTSQSFAVRVAISVTALTLAGAMMGMPFPLGMARFDDRDRSWYWAINGATSVLASVLALVIALLAGFAVVLECAVASYLVAALTLPASAVTAGLAGPRKPLHTPTAAESRPTAA
jgi:spermidine synthase